MKRWSSLRRTEAPIPVALMALRSGNSLSGTARRCPNGPSLFGGLRRARAAAHGLGPGGDRFDDVVVAGAAADVAFELLADGVIVEIVALAAHDIDRGHDHAWRAIAALQTVVLAERLLHRMQLRLRRGEPLDRQHVGAFELQRQHGARLCSLAVDVHDAGAALRGVAADMGAGEPQVFAQ